MKIRLKKYGWAAAALLALPMLATTSCLDKGRQTSSHTILGVVQRDGQDSSRWWFMKDDSTTFYPANKLSVPKEIYRAYATLTLDSDITPVQGYHYTADFSRFDAVKVLPVTASSAAYISDSAPHDKLLGVAYATSLQYLNLQILFSSADATKHNFEMLRDSTQTNQTVELRLSHSNGGASEHEQLGTIISFDLETLAERSRQDSVRLRFISPVNESDSHEFTYWFNK